MSGAGLLPSRRSRDAALDPRAAPVRTLLCLAIALAGTAAAGETEPRLPGAETEPRLPGAARAALLVRPDRVETQPAAAMALGLPWVLRGFASHAALGSRTERFTILVVESAGRRETVGLARGRKDLHEIFAGLRGAPAGSIGPHAIYTLERSPDRVALVGAQEIVEGSPLALRRVLESAAVDPERQGLERTLTAPELPQAAATLLYFSGPDEANLVRILRDLDAIWRGLARLAAPYETPLRLLGTMRGGRADVWQEADTVRVRILLVCPGGLEAKRSLVALRTARQLAPLASDAAVRSGSLTPKDAELVQAVLASMRSRLVDDRIHVDLAVDAATVLPRR